ncbi:G-type lectin S-receptor-like serine/threonine-protein kinase SD2-5 [Acorus gramineus]|uniref:G-type lectin S-receptor-like serine/threonine-protein kinase SD2-5 n=1 Tax=Acorus gramineus TaxID=55184 RepID=A0AAV8ZZZ1_ACOGR|nr:G-type lectin S-receptor-like serine/threonine-protein kinase SD2-5 [Acorus gramineus]
MSKTMEIQVPIFSFFALCLFVALSLEICIGSVQRTQIFPGFRATQITWIDNGGLFLLSNDSTFAFGFVTLGDPTAYLLAVIHQKSKKIVWAANRGALINDTDVFAFGNDGNVVLQSRKTTVWSSGTSKKGASSMILDDSGNLVLLSNNSDILWQSFDHPTDTLLSGQRFVEGMQLVSDPNSSNLSFYLEFGSGDVNLFANFVPQQQYWSMHSERRAVMNKASSVIYSANLTSNSWNFYDRNQDLLLQFIFSTNTDLTVKWAAKLSNDGSISFTNLQSGNPEMTKIPKDSCDTPEACKPYQICISDQSCQCPTILSSDQDCNPDIVNACGSTNSSFDLAKVGDGFGYFAVGFTSPVMKSSLTNCKDACLSNCSCLALFFDDSSGNCFMFSQIGSLQQSISNQISYTSYIKVSNIKGGNTNSNSQNGSGGKHVAVIVIVITLVTVLVVIGLIYAAMRCLCNKKQPMEHLQGSSEEDNFLENISGMPTSEKAHFPTYAFKKMEEGRLKEILDAKLDFDEKDERVMIAIKVALWCIQEDMAMRPSMTKVVQMLEGVTDVPQPPPSSQMGFRLYANLFKSISSEGTSSGPSDCNNDTFISAVRLSGPR